MKLTDREIQFLARLLGHHFTASGGMGVYNLSCKLADYCERNKVKTAPLDGVLRVLPEDTHPYGDRVMLAIDEPPTEG